MKTQRASRSTDSRPRTSTRIPRTFRPRPIAHRETGGTAHFDCILRLLREEHNPGENEKICYLGNGSFGVVQFRPPLRFFVRKRVQYEKTEEVPEWRRGIYRQTR